MKCPKCGSNKLVEVDQTSTKYECKDIYCSKRFDIRDYINYALRWASMDTLKSIESLLIDSVEEKE